MNFNFDTATVPDFTSAANELHANEEQRHKELQSHLSESDYLDLMRTVESYKKACSSHEAQILQLEREFHARTQELTSKRNKYFRQIPHFWAQ